MMGFRIGADAWGQWRRDLEASCRAALTSPSSNKDVAEEDCVHASLARSWQVELLARLDELESQFERDVQQQQQQQQGEAAHTPETLVECSIATPSPPPSPPKAGAVADAEVIPVDVSRGTQSGPIREKRSLGTQLYAVRGILLSRHVLQRVRAERSCKGLSAVIGQLAQTMFVMSNDFIAALCAVVKISGERHGGALVAVQDLIPHLRATTVRMMLAELGVLGKCGCKEDLGNDVDGISQRVVETLAEALQKVGDFDSAPPSSLYPSSSGDTEEARRLFPFLCRRCRQDGRDTYLYDKQAKRLQEVTPWQTTQRQQQQQQQQLSQLSLQMHQARSPGLRPHDTAHLVAQHRLLQRLLPAPPPPPPPLGHAQATSVLPLSSCCLDGCRVSCGVVTRSLSRPPLSQPHKIVPPSSSPRAVQHDVVTGTRGWKQ
ncbi:hypothetical protein DQ04_00931130 [Trypanosoma grayi]|uniref:hypothetical protein n=1 Tax=Trypanosoma grayi TaxID=71804 RepID=UPI0004F43CFE|nr:hypothetical protein DQ04_00931130 [Trypanosoma grayi]KEG13565.1 hypothetical protein DQ04_00931130 [Trypanosoma grayi]